LIARRMAFCCAFAWSGALLLGPLHSPRRERCPG
jgi:hypothetical protein